MAAVRGEYSPPDITAAEPVRGRRGPLSPLPVTQPEPLTFGALIFVGTQEMRAEPDGARSDWHPSLTCHFPHSTCRSLR
jgi:hypothetical protein